MAARRSTGSLDITGESVPKPINWNLVALNISEAREELQSLESMLADRDKRSEGEFEVRLEHAYHHLNFAWNARRASNDQYRHLTQSNFTRWGKFPKSLPMVPDEPPGKSGKR
ncbi:MAG: hypothetical protein ACREQF_10445 [Candidatus Binataceae bacterium]